MGSAFGSSGGEQRRLWATLPADLCLKSFFSVFPLFWFKLKKKSVLGNCHLKGNAGLGPTFSAGIRWPLAKIHQNPGGRVLVGGPRGRPNWKNTPVLRTKRNLWLSMCFLWDGFDWGKNPQNLKKKQRAFLPGLKLDKLRHHREVLKTLKQTIHPLQGSFPGELKLTVTTSQAGLAD